MCAIAAYSSTNRGAWPAFLRVLHESKIRGLHAFGFAWCNSVGVVRTSKFLEFGDLLDAMEIIQPLKTIVHCRYSTSGDYRTMENNQPLLRANQALAFNGVIDMGTKAEMEARHGVTLQTENDGEVPLAVQPEDPFKFFDGFQGSFAGLLLSPSGIRAYRNSRRPAWVTRSGEATMVASTADILRRAGLPPGAMLPPGRAVTL